MQDVTISHASQKHCFEWLAYAIAVQATCVQCMRDAEFGNCKIGNDGQRRWTLIQERIVGNTPTQKYTVVYWSRIVTDFMSVIFQSCKFTWLSRPVHDSIDYVACNANILWQLYAGRRRCWSNAEVLPDHSRMTCEKPGPRFAWLVALASREDLECLSTTTASSSRLTALRRPFVHGSTAQLKRSPVAV